MELALQMLPIVLFFVFGSVIGGLVERRRIQRAAIKQLGCDWHGEGV